VQNRQQKPKKWQKEPTSEYHDYDSRAARGRTSGGAKGT